MKKSSYYDLSGMRVARIAVVVLGGLLLLMFCPLVSGVSNLGSWFGMGVAALILALGLFLQPLCAGLHRAYQSRIGKVVLLAVAIGLSAFVIWALTLIGMMIRRAHAEPPSGPVTVIVLGCRVNGSEPSMALTQRLEAALTFLRQREDTICILSGGQGEDELISEAEAMRRYLTERGIDAERLILEDQSRDTAQNLKNSAELIRMRSLSTDVVLVTHSYHQCRAALMAESEGLSPYAVNAKGSLRSYPTFFLRDLLGVAHKTVFG